MVDCTLQRCFEKQLYQIGKSWFFVWKNTREHSVILLINYRWTPLVCAVIYVLSRFFLFLAQIHFFFISFLPFCCFCLQKSRKVHFIRYKRNLCIIKNPSFVNKSTSFLGQFLSAHSSFKKLITFLFKALLHCVPSSKVFSYHVTFSGAKAHLNHNVQMYSRRKNCFEKSILIFHWHRDSLRLIKEGNYFE